MDIAADYSFGYCYHVCAPSELCFNPWNMVWWTVCKRKLKH